MRNFDNDEVITTLQGYGTPTSSARRKTEFDMTKCTIIPKKLRLAMCLAAGIAAAVTAHLHFSWLIAGLAGWDVAVVLFLLSCARDFSGHSRSRTAQIAQKLDVHGWTLDIVVLIAELASLGAVGAMLSGNHDATNQFVHVAFGLVSIILGWASVHVLFMVRYAAVYYQDEKAIDFNDEAAPMFSDFAYLAFTIGMTYQVSDTNIMSGRMRKVALGHALISFVFGTVIIATTINLVAGLIG